MSAHRTFSVILSIGIIGIIACRTEPASPTPGPGVSPYTLALVGSDDLTLHPDEERLLHVVLTRDDAGPVPDARIHFELRDGDALGARLDAADVITDEDGIARVTLTAGPRPALVPFHLAASTPDLGAAPVAFSIAVIAERRLLEIVPTAATRVRDGGGSATTLAGVSASVALRVRELDADTLEPIAGDPITFTLPPVASSRWSTTSGRIATARTGMGGEARVYLITSQAAEGPWEVVAQGAGGDAAVTFEIRVQGQACPFDPDACGVDDPPPECDPAAPACGSGRCCDPLDRVCRESCVRDDNVPDLSGVWATRHDFNLRQTLPLGVREVLQAVRLMDQTLLGKLTIPGLPGWLQEIVNTFVSRLLQQYLPEWMQQAVHLSDDLFTLLSHLRSEGTMRLARNGDAAHLKGREVWRSLVFYWLPLCDGDISGDPGEPPECARIDVVTSDADGAGETAQCKGQVLPAIRAQISPFTGTVVKQDGGHAGRWVPRRLRGPGPRRGERHRRDRRLRHRRAALRARGPGDRRSGGPGACAGLAALGGHPRLQRQRGRLRTGGRLPLPERRGAWRLRGSPRRGSLDRRPVLPAAGAPAGNLGGSAAGMTVRPQRWGPPGMGCAASAGPNSSSSRCSSARACAAAIGSADSAAAMRCSRNKARSCAFTATVRARTRWLRASSGARSTASSRCLRASSRFPPA